MDTYEVLFNEGETTGVYGISLVNDPAMESMWITLSKEQPLQLKTIDNEKRIVCGAVLIPNKLILRKDNDKEFNIVFPEETIRLASEAFLKNGHQKSSTLEHNPDAKIEGVSVVESWIKLHNENDKSVMYGFKDPIGTWYVSMKIENPEIWDDYVKMGKVKGFSIDGLFGFEKVNLKSEINMSEQKSFIDEVKQIIKDGFANLSLTKEKTVELGSVSTADGSVKFNFDGDTIATGVNLTMTTPDGDMSVPDGEYDLEGGMHITVTGSVVQEVSTAKEEGADTETTPVTPMSSDAPAVKSEKVTSEVFYQLSKEDFNAMVMTFAKQVEETETKLKAEFGKKETTEVVELTKTKPEKKSNEPLTAFEKFREHNKKFK